MCGRGPFCGRWLTGMSVVGMGGLRWLSRLTDMGVIMRFRVRMARVYAMPCVFGVFVVFFHRLSLLRQLRSVFYLLGRARGRRMTNVPNLCDAPFCALPRNRAILILAA